MVAQTTFWNELKNGELKMCFNLCGRQKSVTMRNVSTVTIGRWLYSLIIFLSVSNAVLASKNALELADISEAISQRGTVAGVFFQCHLQDGYGRKSRGRFEIGPETGLVWHITDPVDKRLVITA